MPTYDYVCTQCDHAFEVFQAFSDDALTACPQCEGRLRKVFNSVGVVFKGSGFYRNDSRNAQSTSGSGGGSTESSPTRNDGDKNGSTKDSSTKNDSSKSSSGKDSSTQGDGSSSSSSGSASSAGSGSSAGSSGNSAA